MLSDKKGEKKTEMIIISEIHPTTQHPECMFGMRSNRKTHNSTLTKKLIKYKMKLVGTRQSTILVGTSRAYILYITSRH